LQLKEQEVFAAYDYATGKIMTSYATQGLFPSIVKPNVVSKIIPSAAKMIFNHPTMTLLGTIGMAIGLEAPIELAKKIGAAVIHGAQTLYYGLKGGIEWIESNLIAAEEDITDLLGLTENISTDKCDLTFQDTNHGIELNGQFLEEISCES